MEKCDTVALHDSELKNNFKISQSHTTLSTFIRRLSIDVHSGRLHALFDSFVSCGPLDVHKFLSNFGILRILLNITVSVCFVEIQRLCQAPLLYGRI